ncbi:MAG: tryptophan synthase subunit beta, partial [Desulfobulbaceae bacterium]|nr:tryptophan synthase subunit beta [Desulfobulbaceae bacterium]
MNKKGYYGQWGGAFIPEVLYETFRELGRAFAEVRHDPDFWNEYVQLMASYSCRPTPLTYAANLSDHFGGARIYIKREDLNHTGAHKA